MTHSRPFALAGAIRSPAVFRGEDRDARRHTGTSPYRREPAASDYPAVKRGDEQFRRSLRTTDRKLAERRLSELRPQVGNLSTNEDRTVGFAALAERWFETAQHALKPRTVDRRRRCLQALAPFFRNLTARNITRRHGEQWLTEPGAGIAPQPFAHELDTMRAVFSYAMSIVRRYRSKTGASRSPGDSEARKTMRSELFQPEFRKLADAAEAGRGGLTEFSGHGANLVVRAVANAQT